MMISAESMNEQYGGGVTHTVLPSAGRRAEHGDGQLAGVFGHEASLASAPVLPRHR